MKTHQTRKPSSGISQERTFQEYLAIMLRGKWIILITFVVVMIGTILFTKLSDPVYQSTCKVLLNPAELRSSLFLESQRSDGVKNIVQNELAILNSRALADSVAVVLLRRRYLVPGKEEVIPSIVPLKNLADSSGFAPLDLVSGRVTTAIDFDPVRDSDIISITAKSKSPREAQLIANTYAEAYRDRNIYASRAKSRSFREFLESQAREKKRSLEETESSLQGYMENQGIVSLDDESKRMIEQLASLEATRDATDIALKELSNTLSSYQQQLPQQETNVARVVGEASDTYIKQMQDQLAKLEVSRDMTVVQNPTAAGREILDVRVKEIDAQIAALRLKLQRRTDDYLRTLTPEGGAGDAAGYLKTVKQKIVETGINVMSLQAKKTALNEAIAEYERKFDRIPAKEVQLARLQRARLSNEKLYLMVEEKFNEANITEQSNIGYIEIIEPAPVPGSPSSPKTLINLMLGVVMGLSLGIVLAFVKEYFDVRVQTPEDLKRRGFVPLTPIMNMDPEIERLGRGDGLTAKDRAVDAHLITLSFPFSSIAESYRQMRTNLQFARVGQPVRTLMVTSPAPGEGKSTTACNLAIAFAQTGKRVLLVDADLRRPTLDAKFTLKKEPGLAEYLVGKEKLAAVVQQTRVENLSVICSGEIPPNPAEALGSDTMRKLIAEVVEKYEVVLFDSSPILAVTDPAVISTMVDGTLIVVSSGRTRAADLEQASELLEGVGGKVIGVVMNNFDPHHAYGLSRRTGRGRYSYGQTYYSKSKGELQPGEEKDEHPAG
jgi:capsular exopolysaccharide synthesis family protein